MTSHYKWIHVFFLLCFLLPHTFQAFFQHLGCVNPLDRSPWFPHRRQGRVRWVPFGCHYHRWTLLFGTLRVCISRGNPSKMTGLLGRWVAERKDTLPETNSSSLKIDPWKRRFLLETTIFRGLCLLYTS